MEQARVAMVHAFDLKYKTRVAPILPYGIYTIPECSMAGETEESLTKRGIAYIAGTARYDANARGQIIGAKNGFLKLLFATDTMRLKAVTAGRIETVALRFFRPMALSDTFMASTWRLSASTSAICRCQVSTVTSGMPRMSANCFGVIAASAASST